MFAKTLSMIATAMIALSGAAAYSGYSQSCYDCYYTLADHNPDHFWLNCRCYTGNGGEVSDSGLDINQCYANLGGHLVVQMQGNFLASCQDVGLGEPRYFSVWCGDGGGGWLPNNIDLNDAIENSYGSLTCGTPP